MPGTLLIVDDEEEMGASLKEIFTNEGFNALYTPYPEKTLEILASHQIDLIIMDVRMPGIGGIDLLQNVRDRYTDLPIVMISGYASTDTVVRSMKYGALNFYEKPVDIPALLEEVRPWMCRGQVVAPGHSGMVTKTTNRIMQDIFQVVETAAPTQAPVIITGESGTGKERIANAIHEKSDRCDRPFVKINCAAIPDALLESELFGHEAGAFTDAKSSRAGKFEMADGGTIFFDEIGDMSLNTQAKLLRVLQEREYERLGGNQLLHANVRVLAATNKDLRELISLGEFREDLFYRISVITIHLPPLRDRMEDLLILLENFICEFSTRYGKTIEPLSTEVHNTLLNHSWPGNIRELKNAVERAVIFAKSSSLSIEDFSTQYRNLETLDQDTSKFTTVEARSIVTPERGQLNQIVDTLSKQVIFDALSRAGGSRQKAAEALGINRKTLYNRMKKYDL